MKLSRLIVAVLTAGLFGVLSFGSAHAIQPIKSPAADISNLIEKVSHHGRCYKWRYRHGYKYCYKYRYKKCYKWRYDSYGNRHCHKWRWGYYIKPYYRHHGYRKHYRYKKYHGHKKHYRRGHGY